jgi:hypothetical protein
MSPDAIICWHCRTSTYYHCEDGTVIQDVRWYGMVDTLTTRVVTETLLCSRCVEHFNTLTTREQWKAIQ